MASRRPLVLIGGKAQQLPSSDTLDFGAPVMQTQVLVATSIGQTVWPVSGGYTPNLITLSRNGSDQTPGSGQDYTATDGLNITTTIPALAVGEELLLRKWASIALTDALSTTGQAYDSARLGGVLAADVQAAISARAQIMEFAAQALTSGTAKDFTGIPSWAKEIIIPLYRASSNGSGSPMVQLGTSAGLVTTGYASFINAGQGSAISTNSFTNGIALTGDHNNVMVSNANLILTKVAGTNNWVGSVSFGESNTTFNRGGSGGGSVSLPGVLTQIRFTTSTGDTFTAGSVSMTVKG